MRRDMNLIRQIAFQIEAASQPIDSKQIVVEGYSSDAIGHHCAMMHESSLIVGHSTKTMHEDYPGFHISRLSPLGHDLVNAARSDTVWHNVMDTIKSKVGDVSVELLIAYLKQKASSFLGIDSQ